MPNKKLVIVESPTKAKTISRFLDSSYRVSSCMGHIRDLPQSAKDIPKEYKDKPWKTLGVNVQNNFEPIYCIPKDKKPMIQDLKKALKQSSELILATDEDREGESISWHLFEILKPHLKPKIPVKRIVFHEITKEAIKSALKNYRKIDEGLVKAQEARRVLDRLVGYTLSPLLWKKITTGLSAGRVQSVAVKLISEREIERMNFIKSLYSGIEGEFASPTASPDKRPKKKPPVNKDSFKAQFDSWNSKKIAVGKDFDSKGQLKDKKLLHLTQSVAKELIPALKKTKTWTVQSLEKKPISRSPRPPFITSTLQQAAHSQLRFSPKKTMSLAQKLYEKGLITYMRTDSTHLSNEALKATRKAISDLYGAKELPEKARLYKTKSKGAQEAHEAIRPAGTLFKSPEKTGLPKEEAQLYRLIWQRTLACQMKNCQQEQTRLLLSSEELLFPDICSIKGTLRKSSSKAKALFRSSGLRTVSPGFYRLYKDPTRESDQDLPALKEGDKITCLKLTQKDNETKAPFRYNEASLIQKLEKEGIGRPSTYAPIISTIQERSYVKKTNGALAPTFTALAVSKLLSEHLPNYVDLSFTSKMEKALDNIAEGKTQYVRYLSSFYKGDKGLKQEVKDKEKSIVAEKTRTMNFAPFKGIDFNVGRFGAYISQIKNGKEIKSNLPEDWFLSNIKKEELIALLKTKKKKDEVFTTDPQSKKKIFIKTGRFGPYLEREGGDKRASIPRFLSVETLTKEQALKLLELPKTLGLHPDTKKEVKKSIGRFGPYVIHEGDSRSAPNDLSFLDMDLKQALELLAQEKKSRKKWGVAEKQKALKEFKHKGELIQVLKGFSPYIKYKKQNYSLSKEIDPLKLTLNEALEIIENTRPSVKKKARRKTKKK